MKRHKKIGYKLGDIYWHNIDGFEKLWNDTDFDVKEKCVNDIGLLALNLCKEEYEKKEYKETIKLLLKREEECGVLIVENYKLKKYRNIFLNTTIILILISLTLLISGNFFK